MRNLTSSFADLWSTPSGGVLTSCVVPDGTLYAARQDGDEIEILTSRARLTSVIARGVASLHHYEDQQLCLVTSCGQILLVTTDISPQGDISSGIRAASWSPDDEQLVLVTGDDQLLVMTREFDVVYEAPLRPEDFGEDRPVDVGWGSKQTQFHGAAGKAAREQAQVLPQAPSSEDQPYISWRGDGQYFCVSSLDPYRSNDGSRRQVRIYARDPRIQLSTTSEPIHGLDAPLAWRPSGNLIAAIQHFPLADLPGAAGSARTGVAFLERNGLQHGEFHLGLGRVRWLGYSCDSSVLAVWIDDVVQLWTMGNYHYYLKQVLKPPRRGSSFTSVRWHPERALELHLTGDDWVQRRTFGWETVASEDGTVVVVDGRKLLVTPFAKQNVPPPMCAYEIDVEETPTHVAIAQDKLAVLVNSSWRIYKLEKLSATLESRGEFPAGQYRQVAIGDTVMALGDNALTTPNGSTPIGRCGRLLADSIMTDEGRLYHHDGNLSPQEFTFDVQGQYSLTAGVLRGPSTAIPNVTSFTLTPSHLIWTTNDHQAHFRQLTTNTVESRRVERGSIIVTAVPSRSALVLQMPRGNLETIYPRPLVLAGVGRDVAAGRWRSAFLACRRHRIDLSTLLPIDVPAFVAQIPEVDHLNLFLTSTHDNDVCDAMRQELMPRLTEYVDTILTSYVVKSPPEYEAGLRTLLEVRDAGSSLDEAVKYMIFLTDVNQLYDVALGMYDFELVLLVAQHSQKDPKEYLPFLRELRALDPIYQRFRIDDHLERHSKALGHLLEDPQRFKEALEYMQRHALYAEAIKRERSSPTSRISAIYAAYGRHLLASDPLRAALALRLAGEESASDALESAGDWKQLLTVNPDDDELVERVSTQLTLDRRPLEASRVLLDYAQDTDEAVRVLCRDGEFTEARRLIALAKQPSLESHVLSGLEDAVEQTQESLEDYRTQMQKEMERLEALMARMEDSPDAFFGAEPDVAAFDNLDVATETTAITAFTRFTVGATTFASRSQKSTSVARRKARKQVAGRKGTVDEFEYLLASLKRLLKRVDATYTTLTALLPHLFLSQLVDEALSLEHDAEALSRDLSGAIDRAWSLKSLVDAKRIALIEADLDTLLGASASTVVGMMRDRLIAAERERLAMGPTPAEALTTGEPAVNLIKPAWKGWQGSTGM